LCTKHINSSTRTANVGLNKIQVRAALCVGAGSRMLESVFFLKSFCEEGWRGESPFIHLWGKIDN
jgi:hypothetical protein